MTYDLTELTYVQLIDLLANINAGKLVVDDTNLLRLTRYIEERGKTVLSLLEVINI